MRKLWAYSVLIAILFTGGVGGSYVLGLVALHHSQAQLCTAFELLTARPVPRPPDPASNPSREQNYQFYLTLKQIESAYHCG